MKNLIVFSILTLLFLNQACYAIPPVQLPSAKEFIPMPADRPGRKSLVNIKIGSLGGLLGGGVEMLVPLRHYVKLAQIVHLRFGFGLCWGGNSVGTSFNTAPAYVDGVIPFKISNINYFFGAGLNYPMTTTPNMIGRIGGQVFFGVLRPSFFTPDAILFAEAGYQFFRFADNPTVQGLTLTVGQGYIF